MFIPYLEKDCQYSIYDTKKGKKLEFHTYDKVGQFHEGYAIVETNGHRYYLNDQGMTIRLKNEYTPWGDFTKGVAVVLGESGCRLVNKEGHVISRGSYDQMLTFPSGFTEVSRSNEYDSRYYLGLLDKSGAEIWQPTEDTWISHLPMFILINKRHLYVFVDFAGNIIRRTEEFTFLKMWLLDRGIAYYRKNSEVFLVNGDLERVSYLGKYDEIETLAWNLDAEDYNYDQIPIRKNGKWGVITAQGAVALSFEFDEVEHGLFGAYVLTKNTAERKSFYFINQLSEIYGPFLYQDMEPVANGGIKFQNHLGKWGLMNFQSQIILDAEYDVIDRCSESQVCVGKGGFLSNQFYGKYGVTNVMGEIVCPIVYSESIRFQDGFAIVMLEDKVGVIDQFGKQIIPPIYDKVSPHGTDFFEVEQNERKFIVDLQGREYWFGIEPIDDDLPF